MKKHFLILALSFVFQVVIFAQQDSLKHTLAINVSWAFSDRQRAQAPILYYRHQLSERLFLRFDAGLSHENTLNSGAANFEIQAIKVKSHKVATALGLEKRWVHQANFSFFAGAGIFFRTNTYQLDEDNLDGITIRGGEIIYPYFIKHDIKENDYGINLNARVEYAFTRRWSLGVESSLAGYYRTSRTDYLSAEFESGKVLERYSIDRNEQVVEIWTLSNIFVLYSF